MVYLLRRTLLSLLLVWLVATLIFGVLRLVPGDPAEMLLSSGGVAPDPAAVADLRQRLGLDRPVLEQYLAFISGLGRLDLGTSLQDDQPVIDEIRRRLPRTLELVGAATVLALALGLPLGVLAALRRDRTLDRALSMLSGFLMSVPVFVIGTLMVFVFAQRLRWVPAGGFVTFAEAPLLHLRILLMPAAAIALGFAAVIFRMVRTTTLETLGRDWVRTARAKGLPEGQVLRAHVVRNALGPVLTVVGLHMGTLIGGTVLVEYVFNWPGLSGFLVHAVEQRDYPEVQGIVLVVCALFVSINLAVDMLYAALDPRVRQA